MSNIEALQNVACFRKCYVNIVFNLIFENLKDAIFNILYKMEEDLSFDPHKLEKLTTVHWAVAICTNILAYG